MYPLFTAKYSKQQIISRDLSLFVHKAVMTLLFMPKDQKHQCQNIPLSLSIFNSFKQAQRNISKCFPVLSTQNQSCFYSSTSHLIIVKHIFTFLIMKFSFSKGNDSLHVQMILFWTEYISFHCHGVSHKLQEVYMPLDKYSDSLFTKTILRETKQLQVISVRFYQSSKHSCGRILI